MNNNNNNNNNNKNTDNNNNIIRIVFCRPVRELLAWLLSLFECCWLLLETEPKLKNFPFAMLLFIIEYFFANKSFLLLNSFQVLPSVFGGDFPGPLTVIQTFILLCKVLKFYTLPSGGSHLWILGKDLLYPDVSRQQGPGLPAPAAR